MIPRPARVDAAREAFAADVEHAVAGLAVPTALAWHVVLGLAVGWPAADEDSHPDLAALRGPDGDGGVLVEVATTWIRTGTGCSLSSAWAARIAVCAALGVDLVPAAGLGLAVDPRSLLARLSEDARAGLRLAAWRAAERRALRRPAKDQVPLGAPLPLPLGGRLRRTGCPLCGERTLVTDRHDDGRRRGWCAECKVGFVIRGARARPWETTRGRSRNPYTREEPQSAQIRRRRPRPRNNNPRGGWALPDWGPALGIAASEVPLLAARLGGEPHDHHRDKAKTRATWLGEGSLIVRRVDGAARWAGSPSAGLREAVVVEIERIRDLAATDRVRYDREMAEARVACKHRVWDQWAPSEETTMQLTLYLRDVRGEFWSLSSPRDPTPPIEEKMGVSADDDGTMDLLITKLGKVLGERLPAEDRRRRWQGPGGVVVSVDDDMTTTLTGVSGETWSADCAAADLAMPAATVAKWEAEERTVPAWAAETWRLIGIVVRDARTNRGRR